MHATGWTLELFQFVTVVENKKHFSEGHSSKLMVLFPGAIISLAIEYCVTETVGGCHTIWDFAADAKLCIGAYEIIMDWRTTTTVIRRVDQPATERFGFEDMTESPALPASGNRRHRQRSVRQRTRRNEFRICWLEYSRGAIANMRPPKVGSPPEGVRWVLGPPFLE